MPTKQEQIVEALRKVYDPEIPVNIVDLGLIYDVRLKPALQVASELAGPQPEGLEDAEIHMTLTSPGCPSHVSIEAAVKRAAESVPGVQFAVVIWTWEPQWSPERISAEGRAQLGIEV
jgi:metal-sulfur cluster biosynthetic enzyme